MKTRLRLVLTTLAMASASLAGVAGTPGIVHAQAVPVLRSCTAPANGLAFFSGTVTGAVSPGSFRMQRGSALLDVRYAGTVLVCQGGRPVSANVLASGAVVRVAGRMMALGTASALDAARIDLLRKAAVQNFGGASAPPPFNAGIGGPPPQQNANPLGYTVVRAKQVSAANNRIAVPVSSQASNPQPSSSQPQWNVAGNTSVTKQSTNLQTGGTTSGGSAGTGTTTYTCNSIDWKIASNGAGGSNQQRGHEASCGTAIGSNVNQLITDASTNKIIPRVELTFNTGAPGQSLVLKLTDVMIADVQLSSENSQLMEQITLEAQKLDWQWNGP